MHFAVFPAQVRGGVLPNLQFPHSAHAPHYVAHARAGAFIGNCYLVGTTLRGTVAIKLVVVWLFHHAVLIAAAQQIFARFVDGLYRVDAHVVAQTGLKIGDLEVHTVCHSEAGQSIRLCGVALQLTHSKGGPHAAGVTQGHLRPTVDVGVLRIPGSGTLLGGRLRPSGRIICVLHHGALEEHIVQLVGEGVVFPICDGVCSHSVRRRSGVGIFSAVVVGPGQTGVVGIPSQALIRRGLLTVTTVDEVGCHIVVDPLPDVLVLGNG